MHSSELADYLQSVSVKGRLESSGDFTVDLKSALEKMAGFQLHGAADWALKLLQAAVAVGAAHLITVRLGRKQAEFHFAADESWSIDRLQTVLLDPNPEPERALAHLKAAFWNVGIHHGRPVEFAWPGQSLALVWLGDRFQTVEVGRLSQHFRVTVAHQTRSHTMGFWESLKTCRNSNSALHNTLAARAFTCPVPLTVDGRRVDALHFSPTHGFGPTSQPLLIGRIDEGEPPWTIPPGTLENLRYRKSWLLSGRLLDLSDEANRTTTGKPETWIAYVISLHLHYVSQGKSRYLRHLRLPSQCHWVADGVITHIENFPVAESAVTLACFLSAEGLPTDLTTLRLVDSPERSRRYGKAVGALSGQLELQSGPDFDDLITAHTRGDVAYSVLFAGMGLLTIVALPVSLLFWWAAHKTYTTAGEEPQRIIDEAMEDLKSLRRQWIDLEVRFQGS